MIGPPVIPVGLVEVPLEVCVHYNKKTSVHAKNREEGFHFKLIKFVPHKGWTQGFVYIDAKATSLPDWFTEIQFIVHIKQ